MAGKPKHNYQIRQNLDNTFSILAKNQEGEEFWFGNYSLKQAAVRWGDSHRIPTRYPQVVESASADPFGVESHTTKSIQSDPIDRAVLGLLVQVDIDPSNPIEVAKFLGVEVSQLVMIVDPTNQSQVYQLPKVA
jgi:hypothetical protein